MSLSNVWVQTMADGLVRADQITGIEAHQTPALTGKPVRWLLDVVTMTPIGSGSGEGWMVTPLHRTLVQTGTDPGPAPTALARLLSQLDAISAAGIVVTSRVDPRRGSADGGELVEGAGQVRFRFEPFPSPAPGRHTGAEYL